MSLDIRDTIQSIVGAQGLELLGIVDLAVDRDYENFRGWLAEGRHAGMDYLANHDEIRRDPRLLLNNAKTAIVFALNYFQGDKLSRKPVEPRVAQYARLKDYHKILRKKGEIILNQVRSRLELSGEGRVLVDSAPVLERALAKKTASGFIGKNTLFIHPKKGSYLLLGEIVTSFDLPTDQPSHVDPTKRSDGGGCGTCRRCQVNCPTGALDKDYSIDANKCLSYWTIEHRGAIPFWVWPWLGQYYFGCDICQLSCPYNRDIEVGAVKDKARTFPGLAETALMNQEFYEQNFGGTPLTRAKIDGLRRNAIIALTVTRHPKLAEVLAKAANDESLLVKETVQQAFTFQQRLALSKSPLA